jgi:lysophospholipase
MKIFVLSFFLLAHALAVPESEFEMLWPTEIIPHMESGKQESFTNAQNIRLNYYSFIRHENKKTLIIVPGRSEAAIKYAELIYDFKELGFNIFILDHQGQGFSERRLKDSQKGYVLNFSDYVRDLTQWINEEIQPKAQGHEFYLIAHSMGGTIATLYMSQNPGFFKRAVLSAPMFEIETQPYSEKVARWYSRFLVKIGKGASYAPGRGPYVPAQDTFETNEVTHSSLRFEASKAQLLAQPEIIVGGATSRWVYTSLLATQTIHHKAASIKTPILLFQAGIDTYVKPCRQNEFCNNHSQCTRLEFGNAFHEILMESDAVRTPALTAIKDFFKR